MEDEDLKLFLKRLSLAAETTEVQQQIRVEEIFDKSMDSLLRAKEVVIEQKELEIEELRKKILELENKK